MDVKQAWVTRCVLMLLLPREHQCLGMRYCFSCICPVGVVYSVVTLAHGVTQPLLAARPLAVVMQGCQALLHGGVVMAST
jgi:hypothetical protein